MLEKLLAINEIQKQMLKRMIANAHGGQAELKVEKNRRHAAMATAMLWINSTGLMRRTCDDGDDGVVVVVVMVVVVLLLLLMVLVAVAVAVVTSDGYSKLDGTRSSSV